MSNLTIQPDSNPAKSVNCVDCMTKMTLPMWGDESYRIRCRPCCRKREEQGHAEAQQKRIDGLEMSWHSKCPKQFQETDPGRLPCQDSVKAALEWEKGPTGLLLHGLTGTGKTRTAWLVVKGQHFAGMSFKVLNSLAGLEYAAKFSESAAIVETWVESMIRADILFMDDVFKNKFTDSFEGIIFSIVDRRTENGMPIILTANDTGTSLTSRLSEDRGQPLVRRLREFCKSIQFNLTMKGRGTKVEK